MLIIKWYVDVGSVLTIMVEYNNTHKGHSRLNPGDECFRILTIAFLLF